MANAALVIGGGLAVPGREQKALQVFQEPLVTGTHTPTAIAAFINLTIPPARALDGEKFQLLCHTHLPIATLTYSEDAKRAACKAYITDLWH